MNIAGNGSVASEQEVEEGEARLMLLDCLTDPDRSLVGMILASAASATTPNTLSFPLHHPSRGPFNAADCPLVFVVGKRVSSNLSGIPWAFKRLLEQFQIQDILGGYLAEGLWGNRDARFSFVLSQLFTQQRPLTSQEIREIMDMQPDLFRSFIQFYLLMGDTLSGSPLKKEDWLTREAAQDWATYEGNDRRRFVQRLYETTREAEKPLLDEILRAGS